MPEERDPRGRPAGMAGAGKQTLEGSRDPLIDTMPWTFEDDPAAEKLRAWRASLGESATVEPNSPDARVDEGTPGEGPASPSAASLSLATDDAATADEEAPDPAAAARTALTGAWPIPGGVPGRRRAPERKIPDRGLPREDRALPTGRHARWGVVPVVETPDEKEDDTVAFAALPPAKTPVSVTNAIEVKDLRKSFGGQVAVDGVSFTVPEGSILALLGPNGAGKTTTVNMLTTLLTPDSGSAAVAGHDVVADQAGVRRSIMLTGQFAALDEALTGRENLIMFGRLLGLRKPAARGRAEELLTMFALEYAADRKVREYSGGMRRRIDIACGLVTEPKVVFLDEPTTGLDPRSRQDVWTLVEQLRDSGVTVLLTTQYLEEADMLSDNIVVIDRGRVIAEGSSDELKAQTGAAYCEITPAHPAYLPRLRTKLAEQLGLEVTEKNARVSVPAPRGAETLARVIACTEAAEIPLSDISLRRPSLDEVFMALTDADKR